MQVVRPRLVFATIRRKLVEHSRYSSSYVDHLLVFVPHSWYTSRAVAARRRDLGDCHGVGRQLAAFSSI